MSDSEDDYMSDKLLSGCLKEDVRPGLLFNNSQKRKHEMYKKQQAKKPKSYQQQEKETLEKGLSTAISSENRGFQLLKKMGYRAGTGLGKTVNGIIEPVTIRMKNNAAGVGREQHEEDLVKTKVNIKENTLIAKEKEFQSTHYERRQAIAVHKDFRKAQRICEDLDLKGNKKSPDLEFFWSKSTRDLLRKDKRAIDEEKEEEETEEEITEPMLCDIILYLRKNYSYCLYCGDYVQESQGCPGYFRKDHDE